MKTLPENKLLTTEKITTCDEVHKRTENITTSEEVVKGTDEVQKRTGNITTNEEINKGTEKLEYTKEAVVNFLENNSDRFEGQSKGYSGWFNLDHEFLKEKFLHLNQNSIIFYGNYIEGIYMEPYKIFHAY